jgi:hypothetical protein
MLAGAISKLIPSLASASLLAQAPARRTASKHDTGAAIPAKEISG